MACFISIGRKVSTMIVAGRGGGRLSAAMQTTPRFKARGFSPRGIGQMAHPKNSLSESIVLASGVAGPVGRV
jgi:hypothetical protein